MTTKEILEAFDFVEKEDLQVWPDSCIEALDKQNAEKIIEYLSDSPVSGEQLLVLDLPAFLYSPEKFKLLWKALEKEHGKSFSNRILEEELTPSEEFPRLSEQLGLI